MRTTKKDNNYDICNTFKEWLAKNEHRFDRKCNVRHYKTKGLLGIYFENVTPEIFCHVNERLGVSVWVQFRQKFWDYLCDFDCAIRRAKNGQYYCNLCEKPLFYKTPQELLIAHSFENFLEWANSHLTSSHMLEIMGARGFTAASIVDLKGKPSNNSDIMITKIPVIKGAKFEGLSGISGAPTKQTFDQGGRT